MTALEVEKEFRKGRPVSDRRPPYSFVKRLKALDDGLELFYNPVERRWEIWKKPNKHWLGYGQIVTFPRYIELEDWFERAITILRKLRNRDALVTIDELHYRWEKAKEKRDEEERKRAWKECYEKLTWLLWGRRIFDMGRR